MADRTVKVILTADVSDYERKLARAEQSTSKWQAASAGVGKAVVTGLSVAAGGALGLGAAIAKTGVEYNNLQQTSRAALRTLLGGAEQANAQMDKLDAFARTSPFAKQVFISAQQQLLGFGMAADSVIPTLGAVQDAVAAVGGGNDDIAAIVSTLAEVVSTGKITGDTLNELGLRGIDAATLIGQQMGKTGSEIRSQITAGTLGAQQGLNALVTGMESRFGGAAANVKKTWAGATDRIRAAWRDTASALVEPFVSKNGGGAAVDWANKIADVLRALERQAGPTIQHVLDRLNLDGGSGLDDFLDGVIARIDRFDPRSLDDMIDTLRTLGDEIHDLATAAVPVLTTFSATGVKSFGLTVQAAKPLIDVVAKLLNAVDKLPEPIKEVVAAGAGVGLLASRFGGLSSLINGVAGPLRTFNDQMRVQASLAAMGGQQLGTLGSAAAAASAEASGLSDNVANLGSVATVAVAAAGIVSAANNKFKEWVGNVAQDGGDAVEVLQQIAEQGKVTDQTMQALGSDTAVSFKDALHGVFDRSVLDNANAFAAKVGSLGGILPWGNSDAVDNARIFFASVDAGLSKMLADGQTAQAKNVFKVISDQAAKQGVSVDQLMDQLPQYSQGLDLVARQERAAADAAKLNGSAIDGMGTSAALTTDQLNQLAAAAAKSAVQTFGQQTSVLTSWSGAAYTSALKQVASAREAVGSAALSMARQERDAAEASAEAAKRIVEAQQAELQAQSELNKAREDAVRNLREVQEAVVDTANDEQAATIALERAKLALLDTEGDRHASTLDQQEATLAVAQAERRLQEAQEARADALTAADDANRKGIEGSDLVVAAQQKIADAAAAVAQAQLEAARQARSAMEQQADAGRSYAQAQQQLADAQAAAYKASLKGTFEETLRNAQLFTDGIVELTRRGLDPSLVAELLQAGPQQAAPVIEQMLSDHSGRLIAMANEAKTQFDTMSSQIAEMTRLTNLAVNSNTDQMTQDLSLAMQIAQIIAHNGGVATSQELATTLGVGVDTVNRIRDEFGIGLSIPVSAPNLDATKQGLDNLRLSILGVQNAALQFATTGVPITSSTQQAYIPGATIVGRADGGPIGGVGGPRDDANLIWASRGEFMLSAATYNANRDVVDAMHAGAKFQRLATGGPVGYQQTIVRSPLAQTHTASSGLTGQAIAAAIDHGIAVGLARWGLRMDPSLMVRAVQEQQLRNGLLGDLS